MTVTLLRWEIEVFSDKLIIGSPSGCIRRCNTTLQARRERKTAGILNKKQRFIISRRTSLHKEVEVHQQKWLIVTLEKGISDQVD
jgi:hypothetical protein